MRPTKRSVIPLISVWVLSVASLATSSAHAGGAKMGAFGSGLAPISVVTSDGSPLCPSFSFAQVPHRADLFLGKYRKSDGKSVCGGALTLALFRFDWHSHVMTLLHPVLSVPQSYGKGTITAAYDPYAELFNNEIWVSFECVGAHIAGVSACVAPLSADLSRIDTSRLSIAVSGEDSDAKSPWTFSASTPKLLNYNGQMYLFWSAIKGNKTTHQWVFQEERGVALDMQTNGKFMARGSATNWQPSHTPGLNVSVLSPTPNDPLRSASADVEGFYKTPQGVIALTSIGGQSPNGTCVKPHDKVAGCYMLEIERTSGNPLREHAFNEQRAAGQDLPANPMEYPRIIVGPDNQTYLLANLHPLYSGTAPEGKKVLNQTGYVVVPFPLKDLAFQRTG